MLTCQICGGCRNVWSVNRLYLKHKRLPRPVELLPERGGVCVECRQKYKVRVRW